MKKVWPTLSVLAVAGIVWVILVPISPTGKSSPSAAAEVTTTVTKAKYPAPSVAVDPKSSDKSGLSRENPANISSQNSIASPIAEFIKQHRKNAVEKISADLTSLLQSREFTQAEIDFTVNYVSEVWLHNEGVIKISEAVNSAANYLKLDNQRKNTLNEAVLSSVTNATGTVSFSEFQSCVALRLSQASECAKDVGQELLAAVGAKAEGDVLNWKILQSLQENHDEAVNKAVENCHESREKVEMYFDIGLRGCL